MEYGPKHHIGLDGIISYNTRSKKLFPSDWAFTIATHVFIIVPTSLAIIFVIPISPF